MKNTTEMERQIARLHKIIDADVNYSKKDNIVLSGRAIRQIAHFCGIDVNKWISQQPTYIDGRGIRRPTADIDYSTIVNDIKTAIPIVFYPKGGTQMEIDKIDYFFSSSRYIFAEGIDYEEAVAPIYHRAPLYIDSKGSPIKWRELNSDRMKCLLAYVKE